jgi:hypothetical protein
MRVHPRALIRAVPRCRRVAAMDQLSLHVGAVCLLVVSTRREGLPSPAAIECAAPRRAAPAA